MIFIHVFRLRLEWSTWNHRNSSIVTWPHAIFWCKVIFCAKLLISVFLVLLMQEASIIGLKTRANGQSSGKYFDLCVAVSLATTDNDLQVCSRVPLWQHVYPRKWHVVIWCFVMGSIDVWCKTMGWPPRKRGLSVFNTLCGYLNVLLNLPTYHVYFT